MWDTQQCSCWQKTSCSCHGGAVRSSWDIWAQRAPLRWMAHFPLKTSLWRSSSDGNQRRKTVLYKDFFPHRIGLNYLQWSMVATRLSQHTAAWWDLLLFVASTVCWMDPGPLASLWFEFCLCSTLPYLLLFLMCQINHELNWLRLLPVLLNRATHVPIWPMCYLADGSSDVYGCVGGAGTSLVNFPLDPWLLTQVYVALGFLLLLFFCCVSTDITADLTSHILTHATWLAIFIFFSQGGSSSSVKHWSETRTFVTDL